jgi:mannose-6-phosphate isomerase-like protein (cupin superfamily)
LKVLRIARTELDQMALARIKIGDTSDDGFNYAGEVVAKPWGFEYEITKSNDRSVWALHLSPESETSMHCHLVKHTSLIVMSGRVAVRGLVEMMLLEAGERVEIEAGAFHRTRTSLGAVVVEVESPSNRRDLVRLYDAYGRVGQGY